MLHGKESDFAAFSLAHDIGGCQDGFEEEEEFLLSKAI